MARLRDKRKASLPSIESILLRCSCAGMATSQRWKTYACPKQSSSASSKKESAIVAPKKRYKDQLKRQLALADISLYSWQQEASERDSWRSSVRKASRKFEVERHEAVKERGRRQKERAAPKSSSAQSFVCPKCSRVCASRIRLNNHQRARKN